MLNQAVKTVVLLLVAGLVWSGCQTTGTAVVEEQVKPVPPPPPPVQAQAQAVAILSSSSGSQAGLVMGVQLITSAAQLEALGAESLAALDVNFDESSLVVASLGRRMTGGYWVCICSIQQVGDTLYVKGKANAPGPGDVTTQVINHPYAAAVIAKTSATQVASDIESVTGQEAPKGK